MRTNIPEKLLKIVEEIDVYGNANLTRLTVLKKWFERTERLSAFAIWTANRAVAHKGKTTGADAKLCREARKLLKELPMPKQTAQTMHERLRDYQNEYQQQRWGPVRIIKNWNLLLVEQGLAIYLRHANSPAMGYKLAADYCQHYDPRYGNGLNGPSRTKILEIVRFISTIDEAEPRRE